MRVLVACEFSGIVRDAFAARGWDAWSCDLLPTERPGRHLRADVRDVLDWDWDLLIAHPPCTYLCRAGAQWWPRLKNGEQGAALAFVRELLAAPVERIALENPVGILSTRLRPPDQIIQPWQFGHGEVKKTCLWLKGLLPLRATAIIGGRLERSQNEPPGLDRWKRRSRTLSGIAEAMADQWTRPVLRLEMQSA